MGRKKAIIDIAKELASVAQITAQVMEQVGQDYFLILKSAPNRFRVEITGEQADQFKDSGLTFTSVEKAEEWCKAFVPVNMSYRILFETMQVVKVKEYVPPYLG